MVARSSRARSATQPMLLVAGLLVLIAISASSVYFVNRANEDADAVVHTLQVEDQISILLLQLRRAESAERGFLLTRLESFIAEMQAASNAVTPALQRLQELTSDNPDQTLLLNRLRPLSERRKAEFDQVIAHLSADRSEDALAIVRASAGIMGEIRGIALAMRAAEERLLATRREATERSQQLAMGVSIIGSTIVFLLACASLLLVRRSDRQRAAAQRELQMAYANLETVVDDRTADLREANEEIQRFAYIVSHDLRSPLVNIMGFTSELDELRKDIFGRLSDLRRRAGEKPASPVDGDDGLADEDRPLASDFAESIGFIKSSIARMDRLIGAILELTREGRREFHPAQIDVRELVETIFQSVAHQAAEASAELHVEPLPEIVSDRLALEQIFSNLIDNALKYLTPGVPGDIRIRGKRKLGYAVYEIADNGRGIDPKDHRRIFDLFRRSGTQDRPGLGIGLAHVRALVRRLGGSLSVESELGRGSTFVVTLPAKWSVKESENRSAA